MTITGLLGQIGMRAGFRSHGVTLLELLCVMVIITILASMLLPTVSRAYAKVRGMTEEWEAPEIEALLLAETRRYCVTHPRFQFSSKSDFADKCGFSPKSRGWVIASATDFVPFGFLDHTNKVVLKVHIGRKRSTRFAYTKGDLTIQPPER